MPGKQTSTIQIDKTMPGKKISICTFRIDTKKNKKKQNNTLVARYCNSKETSMKQLN
jgi:hypothetical protein